MNTENKNQNTEAKTNEETMEQQAPQVENQTPETQAPAAPVEEKKEGFVKKMWHKAKKPLAIGAAVVGAFGVGMLTDRFMNKKSSNSTDEVEPEKVEEETTEQ